MKKIAVFDRKFDNNDLKFLSSTIHNNWVSSGGKLTTKFTYNFSKLIKKKYVTLVSSGTSALECAFSALNLKKNDEVILPNFTIVSCLNTILRFNAKPIFIDVSRKTWLMEVDDILKAVTPKTKAILIVNIFGNPFNIKLLKKKLNGKKINIIEDCAESVHSENNGNISGSISDISIFSLYTNKLITSGEGGVVCTSNKIFNDRINGYKNLYFGNKERFNHIKLGYNYRLTELQASIAYSTFLKMHENIKKINKIGYWYQKYLSKNINIEFQTINSNSTKIWWMYPIIIKNSKNNVNKLRSFLLKNNIDTRNLFKPLDTMKFLKNFDYKSFGNKNSNYLYKNGLYLPSSYYLKKSQVKYISNVINDYIS